jgi:RHS repeat-associated protein
MAYDNYGNLICRRDPKGNTTTFDYDTTKTFPIITSNHLGQQILAQYYGVNEQAVTYAGLYGQVKSITDPNGAVATKEYDPFGRPLKETLADGTWTSRDYRFDGIIGSQRVRIDTSDGLWSENYFDGLGRTYLSKVKGPESKIIETKTFYDAKGAVSKNSLPYIGTETPRYVLTDYDAVGRVTRTGQDSPADYIRSLTCYDKDETNIIDPNNHRRREARDSGGRLTMVQEYKGTSSSCSSEGSTSLYATTTYQYDVVGNLVLVTDAKNNQTEMRYDSLGRKRYMRDPDMGEWRYTYDANGNLITQTDAKGQIITFDYDALGRLTTKKHGDTLVLTNTYDEVVSGYFNKGRLTKMTDLSGQAVYKYDSMGRVKSSTKTIDGTAFNLGFSFLNGRLGSITYPDNEIVSYSYDAGYLKGVTGYISYSNFDALGRPWNASYGTGGASSLYTFDPVTKRLSSLSVVSPAHGLLINNSNYGYDNKGNIVSITDGLNKPQANNFTSETYIPVRAHAVGSTGSGRVFSYDNNGNILNDGQRSITYNYDNMPTAVDGVNFTYDGNVTRVKRSWLGLTTVYIDKLYECTNGTCAKYIFAGDTRVAAKVGTQISFYHPDHQGSTSLLTDIYGNRITGIAYDAAGSLVNEIAYYPFGEARAGIISTSVSHMYTGQELDNTGLYNYNARLYDPEMGRFMTPDSIVSDPSNPQSLNRYSYVLNNPLNLVDPTGNTTECSSGENCNTTLTLNSPSRANNNRGQDYSISGEDIAHAAKDFGRSVVKAWHDVGNFLGFGHHSPPPPPSPSIRMNANQYAAGGISTLTFGTTSDQAYSSYAALSMQDYIDSTPDRVMNGLVGMALGPTVGGAGAGRVVNSLVRSEHAILRGLQGRNVGFAVNDIQRARMADVLVQGDGRFVVRGANGREHIITQAGEHITTMNNRSNAAHLNLVRNGTRNPVSQELFDLLKGFVQ